MSRGGSFLVLVVLFVQMALSVYLVTRLYTSENLNDALGLVPF